MNDFISTLPGASFGGGMECRYHKWQTRKQTTVLLRLSLSGFSEQWEQEFKIISAKKVSDWLQPTRFI